MKITRELKEIISRKIDERRREEEKNYTAELDIKRKELDKEFIESSEFKTFLDAYKKLSSKIEELNEAAPMGLKINNRAFGCLGDLAYGYEVGFYRIDYGKMGIWGKYNDLKDSVIIRLSCGDNFEDVKNVLNEYGIEI